jgi:hypothetical protein
LLTLATKIGALALGQSSLARPMLDTFVQKRQFYGALDNDIASSR